MSFPRTRESSVVQKTLGPRFRGDDRRGGRLRGDDGRAATIEGLPPAAPPVLTPSPASSLTFTGERFTPEVRGAIWYEHWHRYAVAVPAATGLHVLDAACGEGYGSAL